MTKPIRRIHDAAFKTKVVLEAFKGLKTLPQLASEFGIHAQQITNWKKQALDKFPTLFESGPIKSTLSEQQCEEIEAPLFQQIGQLKSGRPLGLRVGKKSRFGSLLAVNQSGANLTGRPGKTATAARLCSD